MTSKPQLPITQFQTTEGTSASKRVKAAVKGRPSREAQADAGADVRADILRVAHEEFAERGFSGARINEIAEKIQTTKRMIYYYFEDKEHLYREVLQAAYAEMREGEAKLNLDGMSPEAAMRRLIEFTFDHHWRSPAFIRLVMIENVHHGEHFQQINRLLDLNASTIGRLERIYKRGCEEGVFRTGLKAIELHWHISALCFFNVSNKATFSLGFGEKLFTPTGQRRLREQVTQMVLGLLLNDSPKNQSSKMTTQPQTALNPQIVDFLSEWDARWAECPAGSTPAQRRAFFETVAQAMRLPTPEHVDCEQVHWVATPQGDVRVRVFKDTQAGALQPCLIYMHGGAFMQGSPETHWDITSRLAAWAGVTVVSVDYAKAPERPFPTALYQCAAVVKWAHEQAIQLGVDAQRVAVGGDSAGGNIAASLALMFRGTRHSPVAQLLIYPACDYDQNRPSYVENYDGPLIKVAGMDAVNRMYCPNASDLQNPLAAPLLAQDHSGLAPAYIAVAEFDPLRDSGMAYHDALTGDGVAVTLDKGLGLCHGYLRGMGHCKASVDSLQAMAAWLKAQTQV